MMLFPPVRNLDSNASWYEIRNILNHTRQRVLIQWSMFYPTGWSVLVDNMQPPEHFEIQEFWYENAERRNGRTYPLPAFLSLHGVTRQRHSDTALGQARYVASLRPALGDPFDIGPTSQITSLQPADPIGREARPQEAIPDTRVITVP